MTLPHRVSRVAHHEGQVVQEVEVITEPEMLQEDADGTVWEEHEEQVIIEYPEEGGDGWQYIQGEYYEGDDISGEGEEVVMMEDYGDNVQYRTNSSTMATYIQEYPADEVERVYHRRDRRNMAFNNVTGEYEPQEIHDENRLRPIMRPKMTERKRNTLMRQYNPAATSTFEVYHKRVLEKLAFAKRNPPTAKTEPLGREMGGSYITSESGVVLPLRTEITTNILETEHDQNNTLLDNMFSTRQSIPFTEILTTPKCEECFFIFSNRTEYEKHMKLYHECCSKQPVYPRHQVHCPDPGCVWVCDSHATRVNHVRTDHDRRDLSVDKFTFKNISEFNVWKNDVEEHSSYRMVKASSKALPSGIVTAYFQCTQNFNSTQRRVKCCTAFINVKILQDKTVQAVACLGHHGHQMRTVNTVTRLIRSEICFYLLKGYTEAHIMRIMKSYRPPNRRHHVTVNNIRLVAQKMAQVKRRFDLTDKDLYEKLGECSDDEVIDVVTVEEMMIDRKRVQQ